MGTSGAAAGGGGAVELIENIVLGAAQANLDFTGIPGTYASLRLIGQLRAEDAVVNRNLSVSFNGDIGANYDYAGLHDGAENTQAGVAPPVFTLVPGDGTADTQVQTSNIDIFIPGYTNTSIRKHFTVMSSVLMGGTGGSFYERFGGVSWKNTSAVTQITFSLDTGNFAAGSSVALYGLSG